MNKIKYIFFATLAVALSAIPAMAQAGAATAGDNHRTGPRWFACSRRRSPQSGSSRNGSDAHDHRARTHRVVGAFCAAHRFRCDQAGRRGITHGTTDKLADTGGQTRVRIFFVLKRTIPSVKSLFATRHRAGAF
jgi:hypothetical protein